MAHMHTVWGVHRAVGGFSLLHLRALPGLLSSHLPAPNKCRTTVVLGWFCKCWALILPTFEVQSLPTHVNQVLTVVWSLEYSLRLWSCVEVRLPAGVGSTLLTKMRKHMDMLFRVQGSSSELVLGNREGKTKLKLTRILGFCRDMWSSCSRGSLMVVNSD